MLVLHRGDDHKVYLERYCIAVEQVDGMAGGNKFMIAASLLREKGCDCPDSIVSGIMLIGILHAATHSMPPGVYGGCFLLRELQTRYNFSTTRMYSVNDH
jgi:hypothetical protein